MFGRPWDRATTVLTLVGMLLVTGGARAQWPQWGGPNRNFQVSTAGLADSWPEEGPKHLWRRRLGDGYSSIVVDDGLLFATYRRGAGATEYVVALERATGKTVWEYKYRAEVPRSGREHPGPNSSPLVSGPWLYTIGRNASLHCFEKTSGEVVWRRDLVEEFGVPLGQWGYSPSPIAYGDVVIVPVSRRIADFGHARRAQPGETQTESNESAKGRTLMAFNRADGQVVWKTQDYGIDHSSPISIRWNGQDAVVLVTPEAVFGVDPQDGELLFKREFDQASGYMVTPLWLEGNRLFFSTPDSGSHLLELTGNSDQAETRELWSSRRLRMTFFNPAVAGDYVLGTSGHNPAIMTCLDLNSGKRVWADRTFGGAMLLHGDGKLIILDENGYLALAKVTAEGLTVLAKCKVTERESYVAPTLVGTTLFVRDRKHIMALDLG
jgi:outer membrane protein assembly factor BamB